MDEGRIEELAREGSIVLVCSPMATHLEVREVIDIPNAVL